MPPFDMKLPRKSIGTNIGFARLDNLDTILNSLSAELEKVSVIVNDIDMAIDDLREHYDLYDFSDDTLNTWQANFSDVMRRLEGETEEFDRFAFDGDSIRIQDDEEDE
jgi:hypothetical protein